MNDQPIRAIGMVWYSLEHYAEIKALMEDGHALPATYTQWRLQAEQAERQFRRQGALIVRAHLTPDAFRQHCLRFGKHFDAEGRSHFASWVAQQQYGTSH